MQETTVYLDEKGDEEGPESAWSKGNIKRREEIQMKEITYKRALRCMVTFFSREGLTWGAMLLSNMFDLDRGVVSRDLNYYYDMYMDWRKEGKRIKDWEDLKDD